MASRRTTRPSFRPRLEQLENRCVPTTATFGFSGDTFNYDASAETAASTLHVSRDDDLFTASYWQGNYFISIYSTGINNENITEGSTYADTIQDTGTNIGYSNFFTATYDLSSVAASVTFDWQAGYFGCSHCGITGTGAYAVNFAVTGMPAASLIGIMAYVGAGGSFNFTQSGQVEGRGLSVHTINNGAYASSSIQAIAGGTDTQCATTLIIQDNAAHCTADTELTIQSSYAGSLTLETDGDSGATDSLTMNVTDNGSHGNHLGTVYAPTGHSVTHTSNVDVSYF